MDTLKRIKSWLFVIYFLLLFVPVYKVATILGPLNLDVSELSAGTFFILYFLVVVLISLVTVNHLPKYGNIVEYVFGVSVLLMIGFLIIGMTQNNYQFALSFFLQIVLLAVFVIAKFFPDLAHKGHDALAQGWSKLNKALAGIAPEPTSEALPFPEESDNTASQVAEVSEQNDDDVRYE